MAEAVGTGLPAREERALFMDDGGESSALPMLAALCIDAAVVKDAESRVAALRQDLEALLPHFADSDEFHGVHLGRRLQKKERLTVERANGIPLRDHERAFIFQHTLHRVQDLPGRPRVYCVAYRTTGREPGEPRGRDVRRLMQGLVEWVVEEEEGAITQAVIDYGRQFRHQRDGFAAAGGAAAGAVRCNLEATASRNHLLLQMADLIVYSAYQSQRIEPKSRQRFADVGDWFLDALRPILAPNAGIGGVRHLGP
jgi:hypothetical protein